MTRLHGCASVVLVHGAWADGTSWGKVIDALEAERIRVVAASLPLTSLADDTAALDRALERVEGPVVLVGHAYAGAVIASVRPEKVAALVFIAALAPDEGEKIADVLSRVAPDPRAPRLAPDAHGLIWLPEEAFAAAFAQDASTPELARLAAVQRPILHFRDHGPGGAAAVEGPAELLSRRRARSMIVPETQRFMAERMRARVRSLPVDHTPMVTAPEVVAGLIREAMREIAPGLGDGR